MNNTEINTLKVDKEDYTEKQWDWLLKNWEGIHQLGKQMLEEHLEDEEELSIQTSKLIEISVNMFKSTEDYLEFTNIEDDIVQVELVNWFYDKYRENKDNFSVYKPYEEE